MKESELRGSPEPQDLRGYARNSKNLPKVSNSAYNTSLVVSDTDSMYTESDSPAKVHQMSPPLVEASSSTTTSTTTFSTSSAIVTEANSKASNPTSLAGITNNFHRTSPEGHGSEAPPHPSPEVLPPVSASQEPTSPVSQVREQLYSPPKGVSRSPNMSPVSPSYPAQGKGISTARGPSSPNESRRARSFEDLEQLETVELTSQDHQMNLEHNHQDHQLQKQPPNQEQLQMQQSRYHTAEKLEHQGHDNHDRGHNSDSDSTSSAHGDTGRRYRELVPEEHKDVQYWEKRRRNNEAARKSREKRRIHDMVLEGRISSLENANTRLRRELLTLKERYNLPDSCQFTENEAEATREQGYKSDPLHHQTSVAAAPTISRQHPQQQQHHLHHQQPQHQQRLSLDSVPVTPPAQDLSKPRSMSFSMEHHHISRSLHGPPLGLTSSAGTNSKATSRGGGHPHYTSPPPLLAVPGALPMGVGVFPGSAPSLPVFLSEASRLGHHEEETTIKGGGGGGEGNAFLRSSSPSFSHRQYSQRYLPPHHSNSTLVNKSSGHHHKHQHNITPLPSQVLHPHHRDYSIEPFKNEPMEEGEVRARERSNSTVERRPNYFMDQPNEANLVRRSSLGNFNHYQPTLSPQGHHPYFPPHPAYPGSHSSPRRSTGRSPFLQNRGVPYEGISHSQAAWAPRSPISSHSSDENYDEPLQLTVHRDSAATSTATNLYSSNHDNNSDIRQQPPHDDSSRDSDSIPGHTNSPGNDKAQAPLSTSPISALPLKMRHKLPPGNHDFAYPKDLFPSMASAAVSVAPPSFQPHPHHHPFMNGLAHLSDMAFPQSNPLSLIKADNSPLQYRQPTRRESRNAAARRASATGDMKYLDPKYLERRRRNNEAARKCRENRKTLTKLREAKSDYLESENGKLREELGSLQEEMKQLRELIEKKRMEQGIKEDDLPQHLQPPHVES
ncbi:nuclear factor interleukin-3-regulated protein [Elysia marginata]|uniref:Nuclear factor interleukin-3-regulated protein n=1 Tax=Elysia marginata TaxID=1093978 RepID=A0AAV4HY66_9GAST|nr:nuclear factor interleukin-3-regulated protein [Elysia marginata]